MCLRLLLGTKAPVIMPNGVDFSFFHVWQEVQGTQAKGGMLVCLLMMLIPCVIAWAVTHTRLNFWC